MEKTKWDESIIFTIKPLFLTEVYNFAVFEIVVDGLE